MRRLAVGCGVLTLLASGLLALVYLAALASAVTGVEGATESAAMLGAATLLTVAMGAALVGTGRAATTAGSGRRLAPGTAGSWLVALGLVLVLGRGVLAGNPAASAALFPPLHLMAAVLPALAIAGGMLRGRGAPWRMVTAGLAAGGCLATTLALLIEGLALAVVGGALIVTLESNAEGQAALEAIRQALDAARRGVEAGATDETLAALLLSPVVLVATFGLVGIIAPAVEELVKMGVVVALGPRDRRSAWSWGVVVGAGFGVTEAVVYGAMGLAAWPSGMLVRATATLMHATMTGVAALGWHQLAAERRWAGGLTRIALAIAGHGLWNALVLGNVVAELGAGPPGATWPAIVDAASLSGVFLLFAVILLGFRGLARSMGKDDASSSVLYSRPSDHGGDMSAIDHARADRDGALARLVDLLCIPSVSAVPEHAEDVRRAAEWVAARMRAAGIGDVRVDDTDGHPVVYGALTGDPGAPTVLVYGHYDVQPPDPLEAWATPPFEATVDGGVIRARGASDDKGQLLAHIEAAAAFVATAGRPPVNLKFVIEGEEEIGSPSLDGWLRAHADELSADVAVISDTAMVAPGQPSIIYGLRGLAYVEIEITGPRRDLHSGQFGGAVLNPAHVLARIVASLHDDEGRITIPGFYDRVRPLDDSERAALAGIPFDVEAFRRDTGPAGGWGEAGYSVVERLGARPTLDVNGLWSGWTGAGAKTVLPARAHAKISMRLVPDQEPGEIVRLFTDYVTALVPEGASVSIRPMHGARPAIVDRDTPAMRAAAQAYEIGFGRAPVFAREGGSIPVVSQLEDILGLSTVLMGFGLPDDNLHAPNEKLDVDNYFRGIETVIAFHDALARGKRMTLSEIHGRLGDTTVLFTLVLALWALALGARRRGIDGNYLGAVIVGELLIVSQGALGVVLYSLQDAAPARGALHFLYGAVTMLVWPFVFTYTRGGEGSARQSLLYAAAALFLFGLALRAIATGAG